MTKMSVSHFLRLISVLIWLYEFQFRKTTFEHSLQTGQKTSRKESATTNLDTTDIWRPSILY